MRGGRQPAKPDVGRPFDGRVRALAFVHEAHRSGLFCWPPAYAEPRADRVPAHGWSGKGLNWLTARRSTAARSANNRLTLLPGAEAWRYRYTRTSVQSDRARRPPGLHAFPSDRWADNLRLGTSFGSIWFRADLDLVRRRLGLCQAAEATRRDREMHAKASRRP